jgi:Holliday junction resolvase RusA-like endonuclease
MRSIIITVPIPSPKLAHNGRIHWRQRAKLVKECRLSSGILARQALEGKPAPKWDKATAKVIAYFPTNAFPDPMNLLDLCKAVFDGFEDAQIIIDDANLWPLRPEMHKDKDRPRLEITITKED